MLELDFGGGGKGLVAACYGIDHFVGQMIERLAGDGVGEGYGDTAVATVGNVAHEGI